MAKNLGIWMALGMLVFAGMLASRFLDTSLSQDEYKAILKQQFHLPEDIGFASFLKSDAARHSTGIEGIVQFTPLQFEAYAATLDDPNVWRHTPFRYREKVAGPLAQPGALRWQPHSEAFLTKDQSMALFWLRWGRSHGKPDDGGTPINGAKPWRSFCFAVTQPALDSRVVACNDLPANGSSTTLFGPGQRPAFYVRGLLDRDARRLYMYVR